MPHFLYTYQADLFTLLQLIYLPTTPTPTLQSLSVPLLNLQDTHVTAPFFGPNIWEGILLPVPAGGIPQHHTLVPLKLTFKEGGAFDFSSVYERIRETLSQAVDVARESGRPVTNGGIDVDLEQLPAYEEATAGGGERQAAPRIQRPVPISPNGERPRRAPAANNGVVGLSSEANARPAESEIGACAPPPDEPPPGYEEAQGSVASSLGRGMGKTG